MRAVDRGEPIIDDADAMLVNSGMAWSRCATTRRTATPIGSVSTERSSASTLVAGDGLVPSGGYLHLVIAHDLEDG